MILPNFSAVSLISVNSESFYAAQANACPLAEIISEKRLCSCGLDSFSDKPLGIFFQIHHADTLYEVCVVAIDDDVLVCCHFVN